MSDVSQGELAEIRARLTKLESSQVGAFGRGLVWFAGFVIVSVVAIVIAAVWTTQAEKAAARKMALGRTVTTEQILGRTLTAEQIEGRCEADGYRIYAASPDRALVMRDYVRACARSSGYNFVPTAKACAATPPERQPLTPGCYVKDPAAWPKAN